MADARLRNAAALAEMIAPHQGVIDPLRPDFRLGEVPQTYPVLIRHGSRDTLYEQMNQSGFGVVTLYHTMVKQIRDEEFPASHRLARQILNLPVHHETGAAELRLLVDELLRQTER